MKRIILDLCGGTGSWSKPYKEAGYQVFNVTLPEHDVTWIGNNGISLILYRADHKAEPTYVSLRDVYGILAAPPCTMFSLARTTAKTPRDLKGGMEIVEACLRIIWEVRKHHKLAFWALENPYGLLRQFLGIPPLTFDPLDFGERYTKKTDLWGNYNLTGIVQQMNPNKLTLEERYRMKINNRKLPELPNDYILPKGESKQSARRAITPQGFAQAFYKANL